jgi:glutamate--cysteine ligase
MNTLLKIFEDKFPIMVEWCRAKSIKSLFYFSADIRNAGFKITPVDANFFPAGFNLLSENSRKSASEIIKKKYSNKKILLVIENHTRNLHYFENVNALKNILENANNEVKISNLSQESSEIIEIEKIERIKDKIYTQSGYEPDLIVINNDMISEEPKILSGIEQKCIPSINLGWFNRRKENYFKYYDEILSDFCNEFKIDKWLLSAKFESCKNIDFQKRQGIECVAIAVEKLLIQIQKKYDEYNIQQKPYAFVKTSSGSYGIGIISVDNSDEILNMNKKVRNKIHVTKERKIVDNVIIQEGVHTADTYNNHPSEILSYFVLNETIASIYRYNTMSDFKSNLNSKGMNFIDMTSKLQQDKILQIVNKLILIAAEQEALSAN